MDSNLYDGIISGIFFCLAKSTFWKWRCHDLSSLYRICEHGLVTAYEERGSYLCSCHNEEPEKAFGITIARDSQVVHPKSFCKPCFTVEEGDVCPSPALSEAVQMAVNRL